MSDSEAGMQKKINGAASLKSVVRTMKAMAASSIIQYERASLSLDDYYQAVTMGLGVCLKQYTASGALANVRPSRGPAPPGAVVFGSDQGMVGQFNEAIADFAVDFLTKDGVRPVIWVVGERALEHFQDFGLTPAVLFPVPNSVRAITPLVGDILLAAESSRTNGDISELYLFYNHHERESVFEPAAKRLLPLDEPWLAEMTALKWPSTNLPEIVGDGNTTLLSLIHEYLFVSIFRACADSLASENASRLAAMQRADKNIGELLEDLNRSYQNFRQNAIDEELFDVISGYETVKATPKD